jgi:hypothetical protein
MKMKHSLRALGIFAVCTYVGLHSAISQTDSVAADALVLASLKSDFDLLKLLGLCGIALSVALGLALFAYRHKRLMQYDALFGLLLTIVLAPLLFFVFSQIALGPDSNACFSAAIASGAEAVPFDAACGSAREGAANMVGMKSLWRSVMGETVVNGMVAPLGAAAVKFLMYLSVLLGAVILYLVIRPVLKRIS